MTVLCTPELSIRCQQRIAGLPTSKPLSCSFRIGSLTSLAAARPGHAVLVQRNSLSESSLSNLSENSRGANNVPPFVQVVQPINGDPFIGMLETPVTSSPLVAGFLSNLPAYRTGVSPLLRGVEVGLAHGLIITGIPPCALSEPPRLLPSSQIYACISREDLPGPMTGASQLVGLSAVPGVAGPFIKLGPLRNVPEVAERAGVLSSAGLVVILTLWYVLHQHQRRPIAPGPGGFVVMRIICLQAPDLSRQRILHLYWHLPCYLWGVGSDPSIKSLFPCSLAIYGAATFQQEQPKLGVKTLSGREIERDPLQVSRPLPRSSLQAFRIRSKILKLHTCH